MELFNLLLAAFLGGLVGVEREVRKHSPAGIRTHMIVALGACLCAIISMRLGNGKVDLTRIAAQVVAGISFLGMGIIIKDGEHVHGLTTAAGLWTVAIIGLAGGFGFWDIAVGATVTLLGVTYGVDKLKHLIEPKNEK